MNRRGFTLIELLAVIVVLGLVLVVTVPSIIGNINNNKLSSLHTLSKEVATWCDRKIVEDKLSTDTEKILTNINNNEWYCINNVNGVNIAKIYGLSDKNVKLDGDVTMKINSDGTISNVADISNMCSAIKLVDGKAEVLLIAKEGGEFDTNSSIGTYALSSASEGYNK